MGHRYPSDMDLLKMLSNLREERKQLTEAIVALERIALGRRMRQGRPLAWMKNLEEETPEDAAVHPAVKIN